MKVIKGAKILSDLKKDGWFIVHQKGSHRKFKHSVKKGSVTVNGTAATDFTGDLLKSIENQSGLIF
ncbi:MAG: type II toxin-antitoxin system HicA family toxin [Prevotellaceae bacterium]|jgi:predicted RNA binding protein YcfA (HicA-like mRNA interferase family)|nr:type II toxin-antitoxin system HicA family toxin [Prevotellaceae bacterium]